MDIGRALDLELVGLGEAGEGRPAVERLDHRRGLGRKRLGDLFLAPVAFDAVLDLVEAAIMGRLDLGHLEPDEAAVWASRPAASSTPTSVGKQCAQQFGLVVETLDRRVGAVAALGVDRGNRARLEPDRLGRLGQRLPGRPRVLDLVVNAADVVRGAIDRDFLLQPLGDLLERLDARRRHLGGAQDHRAELAFDDVADRAGREREGGVRDRLVENPRARDVAEVDVLVGEVARLGDVVEARAGLDLGASASPPPPRRGNDLLDLPILRRREALCPSPCHRARLRIRVRRPRPAWRGVGRRDQRARRARDIPAPDSSPCASSK